MSVPEGETPDRDADAAQDDAAQPGQAEQPVSGLRNPAAAVRGVGAAALCTEALVLLLALVPLHVLHVRMAGLAIGIAVGLAVVCVLLAGALRWVWAWWAPIGVQVVLLGCGYFHPSLAVLGVVFALVWFYVLSVRRSVLGRR
ncbi:MAG TPA: DUF4233 domain-containing protein [Micromonosporaceae bacterium]|nr:DUF4233 domain-containing protein [Micromonosporaceae bacterium]